MTIWEGAPDAAPKRQRNVHEELLDLKLKLFLSFVLNLALIGLTMFLWGALQAASQGAPWVKRCG